MKITTYACIGLWIASTVACSAAKTDGSTPNGGPSAPGAGGGDGDGGTTSTDAAAGNHAPAGLTACGAAVAAPTSCAPTKFSLSPAVVYPSADKTSNESVAIADMNCDGKLDLVTGNYAASGKSSVGVLLNKGDGTFTTAAFPVEIDRFEVAVQTVGIGDLDGDGFPDVVSNSNTTNSPGTYQLNNGDGTLSAAKAIALPSSGFAIFVRDLNGDGKADVAEGTSGGFSVALNAGAASFPGSVDYRMDNDHTPKDLLLADLNGDGAPDMLITDKDGNVDVFMNDGHGAFSTPNVIAGGTAAAFITAADFDGDGKVDLAMSATDSFGILPGKGDGSFGNPTKFPNGLRSASGGQLVAADLNGDGKPDLAVADEESNTLMLFMNPGDGKFGKGAATTSGVTNGLSGLIAGDFKATGVLSLAAVGYNGVSVLLGACQ